MTDKRIEKRLERKVRVRVVDAAESFPAITDNVSEHGLKIRSGRRYEANKRVTIVIDPDREAPPLEIPATVSWDGERSSPEGAVTREVGFRVDDPPPEFFEQLLTHDGERLFDRLERIHALPMIVLDLMALLNDPSSSSVLIERKLYGDQALAAYILRLVNSPIYGFYDRISSLRTATSLLGFSTLRSHLMTYFTQTLLHAISDKTLQRHLWRHALAAALFARRIAGKCGEDGDVAYVAGLLHDIGKAGLFFLDPDGYRQVMAEYAKHPIDFAEVEAQQFGFSHLPVGSMLLARWNLPETLVEVVRHHHRPDRAPSQSKLSFITAAANGLAHELGLHGHWAVDPWLSRLDIDPEEALSWTESIRLEVEEILGA